MQSFSRCRISIFLAMKIIDTSGVLHICTSKSLKAFFSKEPYSHQFPKDVLPLVNKGGMISIPILSGEIARVKIGIYHTLEETQSYPNVIKYNIFLDDFDSVIVLSHTVFTQITSTYLGDVSRFNFQEDPIIVPGLSQGWYQLEIFYKALDFEEDEAYLAILINVEKLSSDVFAEIMKELPEIDTD